MMVTKKTGLISAMLMGILLYGCGGDQSPTPTPTPTLASTSTATTEGSIGDDDGTAVATTAMPSGSVANLLRTATDTMREAKAFQYEVEITMYAGDATPTTDEVEDAADDVSGLPSDRPLTEEEIERLTTAIGPQLFVTGQGAYVAPDRARLKMTPNVPPGTDAIGLEFLEFPIIVVSNQSFVYNSGVKDYFAWSFDSGVGIHSVLAGNMSSNAVLFDPYGVPDFNQVAQNALIKDEEGLDGIAVMHVEYEIPAEYTAGKAFGEVWIEKGTNHIRRLRLSNTVDSIVYTGSETRVLNITYSKFGEDVSPAIEEPDIIVPFPTMQP